MARNKEDILQDLKDAKEALEVAETPDEVKDFKELVDALEEEVKLLEKSAEVKEEIKEIKAEIKSAETPKEEKKLEEKLAEQEEELEEIQQEAKEVAEKGKRGRKKGVKVGSYKTKGKAKKEKPEKKHAAPKKHEAKEAKKEEAYVIVAGKKYDANDCRQLILAHRARKKQKAKTAGKYKTTSPTTKATSNVESFFKNIGKVILKDKRVETKPEFVGKKLEDAKKALNNFFTVLGTLLPDSSVKALKKSLGEIEDLIEKVEKQAEKANK